MTYKFTWKSGAGFEAISSKLSTNLRLHRKRFTVFFYHATCIRSIRWFLQLNQKYFGKCMKICRMQQLKFQKYLRFLFSFVFVFCCIVDATEQFCIYVMTGRTLFGISVEIGFLGNWLKSLCIKSKKKNLKPYLCAQHISALWPISEMNLPSSFVFVVLLCSRLNGFVNACFGHFHSKNILYQ